ncbi:SRPBCC family protein [Chthonobacter albigriseus]|uniref:SRPBCC family protein n=1 Tax=Chthonobacter albigriseus TaxID=1683161 RepID=UPI0015EF3504|nr:SRPBCC family protein [Chthonobacter albigriseus]
MAGSLVRHEDVRIRSRAAPGEVFDALDEHRNLAAHMGRGSLMMGGGGMVTTIDERGGRAVGSKISMVGRAFGFSLGLEEVVTEREPPVRKVWETVGSPALVVIGGYRMGFEVTSNGQGSRVRLFIDYDLPIRNRWLGVLFGRLFARWCLGRMAQAVPEPVRPQPPADAWVVLLGLGVLAMIMGLAFILVRPSFVLLPEDSAFTGLTPDQLRTFSPQLFAWIGMVFRSWGGFALGLGTMTAATAATAFRAGERWAWWTLAATGALTLGTFAAVNAAIASDFLPVILAAAAAWVFALWRGRVAL